MPDSEDNAAVPMVLRRFTMFSRGGPDYSALFCGSMNSGVGSPLSLVPGLARIVVRICRASESSRSFQEPPHCAGVLHATIGVMENSVILVQGFGFDVPGRLLASPGSPTIRFMGLRAPAWLRCPTGYHRRLGCRRSEYWHQSARSRLG
jgi:hypothetical protein